MQNPRLSLAWALVAIVLLTAWQILTVRYNRGGNWTALFCSGASAVVPPQAGSRNLPL
jgi:hypothetical protein